MMLILNIYRHHHPMGNKKAMRSILDILTINHWRIVKTKSLTTTRLKRFPCLFISCMSYRCFIYLFVIC